MKRVLSIYCVGDRAQFANPLLVAFRPCAVHLIDFINIRKLIYDHSYNLAAVIMAWETKKKVDWLADSPISAAQWLPGKFSHEMFSSFLTAGNIFDTVHWIEL